MIAYRIPSTNCDATGNMTLDPSESPAYAYQWDAEGRLLSVDNGTYLTSTYNALGQREQVTYRSNQYTYEQLWGPAGEEMGTCDGVGSGLLCDSSSWVKLGGRNLGSYDSTGSGFDHVNNLGSTTIGTWYDGSVVDETIRYPFGEVWNYLTGNGDFRFAGMQDAFDAGVLWPVYHDITPNRRYNSSLYRWLSPDPLFFQASMVSDPQRFNLYAYVRNNPTSITDPSGEAIELNGDDDERKKELAYLKNAVGDQAGKYLYDNVDPDTGKHYVGIYTNGPDANGPAFESINGVAADLGGVINDKNVAVMDVVAPGYDDHRCVRTHGDD